MKPLPLPTTDPLTGGPLVVTRLQNPETGMALEGVFDLGWMGRLTRGQLDFVGVLLKHRANVQRLAGEVGISYNTARARLDDIVRALGGGARAPPCGDQGDTRRALEDQPSAPRQDARLLLA